MPFLKGIVNKIAHFWESLLPQATKSGVIVFLVLPVALFSSDPRSDKKLAGSYLLDLFNPNVEQQVGSLDSDEYRALQLVWLERLFCFLHPLRRPTTALSFTGWR